MSLRDAIELMRQRAGMVPPVPPPEIVGEPLEAAPFKEVPPVPPVPPEKPKSETDSGSAAASMERAENPQRRDIDFRVLGEPGEPSPEPDEPPEPPADTDLAALIRETAKAHGADPLTVWYWLAPEDIEALRSGDPVEIRAFRAAVGSAAINGRLTPDGGHDLPFPGGDPTPEPAAYAPFDSAAMAAIRAGKAVKVWCGLLDEAVWWVRDDAAAKKLKRKPWYDGAPVYTLGELLMLTKANDGHIRAVHKIKREFDGTVIATEGSL
ncbi:protein of unknown function [Candidatus Methylocalor cossyra]|uniref:Uncharacterized protein n=2 Tax=Candidatus Methylocalor cossyra TaxID=3108543 RepID=A0ABP1CCM3_9GAMM